MTSGMMLPPELSGLLNTLGFSWPLSDEGKLKELGDKWSEFAERLSPAAEEADGHAQEILGKNSGAAMEAFNKYWSDGEAPKKNLEDGATGAEVMSAGMQVLAGIVIALKTAVIVQLVVLAAQIAQAIATAAVTFGASLAEIPVFRTIAKTLMDQALDLAINSVLSNA